jgi:DNA-binding transcriptional LysR family regulator
MSPTTLRWKVCIAGGEHWRVIVHRRPCPRKRVTGSALAVGAHRCAATGAHISGSSLCIRSLSGFLRHVQRRLALTLPHLYPAPMLIAQSDMVSTMMAGVIASSGCAEQLKIFEPPVALDAVTFVMLWHRRNDAHPAQRWLRDCIASLPLKQEDHGSDPSRGRRRRLDPRRR